LTLERERQKIQLNVQEKEQNLKKFNDLIEQSEAAMDKMVQNSRKLNDALGAALAYD